MLQPRLLLVDEPSIGLEPRYVEDVFEMLLRLKNTEDLSILMPEQNILKALDVADFVYVLSGRQVAMAARSGELDPNALRAAFLGG